MRTQIYTADIVNLETVTQAEDGTETRSNTIVPNVDGVLTFNIDTFSQLFQAAQPSEPERDTRMIVLVSPDITGGFSSNGLDSYFDPIERVSDIEKGNFGSILGLQVILNTASEQSCLAVANVLDSDTDGVVILSYAAASVSL